MINRLFVFTAGAALALVSPFNVHAGQQVCGRTFDTTGLNVAHASVTIYSRDSDAKLTTQSDEAGRYCFAQLTRGDYLLQADAPNQQMASAQSFNLTDSTDKLPDLVLEIAPTSSQVTVTGNGFPQSPSETSKETNVISVEEAEAQGRDSLVSALDLTPGLRVSQQGGPGSFANIQIRGLRTFDTSILVDGMRLRDVSATQGDASSFLSDLWFADSSRIEVLQGAGASLYGTNSIGGVVNMVTDQGGGPLHGDIDLQGGMLGQFFGKVHLAGGVRNRLFYSAGFGHVDVANGVNGNGQYRNTGGLGSLEYLLRPTFRIGSRVIGAGTFGQLQDNPIPLPPAVTPPGAINAVALPLSQIPAAVASISAGTPFNFGNATFIPAYGDPDDYRVVRFISTLLYAEHEIRPNLHYRLKFQDLDTNRNYVNGPLGLGYQPFDRTSTRYDSRTDTANATLEWQPIHSQLLSAGYEFERESFSSPSYTGQTPVFVSSTGAVQSSNTAFVQSQTKLLNDRLQISLSGRYQSFDLSAPTFSGVFPVYASASATSPPSAFTGDASLAYFIRSTDTKFRSHIGNAYRAPSLYERFGTYFYGSSFSAYGDPRLSPERAISMDFGFDQYFASDKIKISASYFYTRLQETIGYDPGILVNPSTDPYGRYGGYYNTPGGLARGVEVSAEAKLPRRIIVRSGYTYTNSIDRISLYSDGQLQTPGIWPQTFSLIVMKSFGKHWDTSVDFLAGSRFFYPLYNSLPPYNVLAYSFAGPRKVNATVGYTHPLSERMKLRIYARLENLANQTYSEDGFPTPGFVAKGGVQFSF
jgi:iron complex outermembrane receptor protein